ncbi:MAG: hypothetical protein K2X39_09095 [Silvanigrellaceae bacterium]|nr:hypothetical protein [Silvanigrellaceae bacterium]
MQAVNWIRQEGVKGLKSPLKTYAFVSGEQVETIIIALHGFGDNAQNFAFLGQQFPIQNALWLFPQGPKPASGIPNGAQWFPLFADPAFEKKQSQEFLQILIENTLQATSLRSRNLFLLGFSQGGAVALYSAHRCIDPLGGIVVMSGFLSDCYLNSKTFSQNTLENTPILLTHGLEDNVVFPAMMFDCHVTLKNLGIKNLTYKTYCATHTITNDMVFDVKKFIEGHR